jgi:hypothetical protein
MGKDSSTTRPAEPPAPLGVLDAMGLGWRLLMSDFWRLWLVALVLMLVAWAVGTFGLPAAILVTPPLMAGLFYVLARRMDGGPVQVGDLFRGFKERFGESVVAYLPVSLGSVAFGVLIGLSAWLLIMLCAGLAAAAEGDDLAVGLAVATGVLMFLVFECVLIVALGVLILFFYFAPAAVWDHPGAGWEAAKTSARLVRDHFGSMLGFLVLFALISAAANILGMMACCVGWLVTMPAVTVWAYATLLYLYRSWTGRPVGTPDVNQTA